MAAERHDAELLTPDFQVSTKARARNGDVGDFHLYRQTLRFCNAGSAVAVGAEKRQQSAVIQ